MVPSVQLAAYAEAPPGWLALARDCGLFYHHPEWIDGLGRCYRLPVTYLAVEAQGDLLGGLPILEVPALFGRRRLVSLPFSYAAGPITRSPEVFDFLLRGVLEYANQRGIKRVEIKHVDGRNDPPAGFSRVIHYSTYRVSTESGEKAVWGSLHANSTRRSIRKGGDAGVEVFRGHTESDWVAMAQLEERTAHAHGVPAPPRRFFLDLCRDLQRAGLADLYLARIRDHGLAAGVLIWKGWREWIYAFGPSRPNLLAYRPNHVLIWRALRDAIAAGVTFDLGRAAPEQAGLVEFKRRWGGVPIPLAYDYWPGAAGLNVARRDRGSLALAARLWARMPVSVGRCGSRLYRFLG
jgi:hypothetical protein